MKYCQNCGQEIADTVTYCPHCSAPQHTSHPTVPGSKKLHCPECKSTRLSAIVETSVNGGTAVHTRMTRRVGVSSVTTSSTHRNYWMCNDCGHKFRNLQNLKEEIAKETKRMKVSLIWCILCAVFAVLIFMSEEMRFFFGFAGFLLLVMALLFLAIWISARGKVSAMSRERNYLEQNCFN